MEQNHDTVLKEVEQNHDTVLKEVEQNHDTVLKKMEQNHTIAIADAIARYEVVHSETVALLQCDLDQLQGRFDQLVSESKREGTAVFNTELVLSY